MIRRSRVPLLLAGWAFWVGLMMAGERLRAQDPPAAGAPAEATGTFVRDRSKKLFHRPECPILKRVSARYRTEAADLAAASAMAYRACPICKPGEAPEEAPDGATAGAPAEAASLSFSKDIAPILVGNCVGCHNARAGERRNNFNLTTFAGLMKGGDSGSPIVPGKPGESLLIRRVRGDGVGKMPPNQRTLAEPTIARLSAWIEAGAKLDEGLSADAELASYAAPPEELRRGELARRKPQEVDQQTEATGLSRWKQASSNPPTVTPGARFLLFSQLPADRAKALVKTLDAQVNPLRAVLQGVPSSRVLAGPEKISLYVFNDENTYIAFVRAVENREVEAGATPAHGNLGVEAPYLAAADPLLGAEEPKGSSARKSARSKRDEEPAGPSRSLAGLLSEQLGVSAVAASGQAPRWMSLGLGAYLAHQVEPRSPYYRAMRGEVANLYVQGWMSLTREALAGEGEADRIRAVGFSLLEFLGTGDRRFVPLFLGEMAKDPKRFDDVIQANLGAKPEQFFQAWGGFVASRYGRGR